MGTEAMPMVKFLAAVCLACCAGVAWAADPAAPDSYTIDFNTDINGTTTVSLAINRSMAPLGADHLHALVSAGFYDGAAFFRVVPDFVVQFGIAGTPEMNTKWSTPIKDDPVIGSNTEATLTYATAGANTRTSQLFVNYGNNARLDSMGFAPFGKVTNGFDALKRVFNPTPGSSGGVDQGQYTAKGDAWLTKAYPGTNLITKATIRN